ncbi:ankyrin repeat domain-containing protein [Legionella sp. CNM-1927-20]|uniref:ankyrin repeat domain-containing protein n=1 Tax=Legionella sp. CNM-1927-20 TaxID=3422221 RepID=UPI00403ABAF3
MENLKEKIREVDFNGVYKLIKEAQKRNYDLNFNDPKTKYTPLHFAIARATDSNETDMLEIIKLLKDSGCDINKVAKDSYNNAPMHTACRRALPSIVIWLIENGVDKNVKNKTNQTPMDYVNKQIKSAEERNQGRIKERLMDVKDALQINFLGFLKKF